MPASIRLKIWGNLRHLRQHRPGAWGPGVTLFDIFNYSTALATFSSSTSGTADRLLQVNGVRVTYNPALSPTPGGGHTSMLALCELALGGLKVGGRLGLLPPPPHGMMFDFRVC